MKKIIILIPIIFVAALGISVGLQLYSSPNFSGFGKTSLGEPKVTYLPGGQGAGIGPDGEVLYNWEDHPVYIIGDSLTQGARKEIGKAIKDATVDAKVSRGMGEGLTILEGWDDAGILAEDAIIVVCLANNITGTTEKDAQRVIDMIRPGQSLIMMTGHGRSNMQPANDFIRSLPRAYSYITVADWDQTIAQSPNLLSDDGIHISKNQGNEIYANLIVSALEVTKPMPY